MILKNKNTDRAVFSQFDLLGNDEIALSKAFAFLLSQNRNCFFAFLKFMRIDVTNNLKDYDEASIEIEKKRDEGRTDIEIIQKNKFHIIVECKIKKGKATKQRTQYLTAFNDNAKQKVLCILTQERDTNIQMPDDVIIKNINWHKIIMLYDNKKFTKDLIVSDFLKYITKNYKTNEMKEILIQDLGNELEIKRYEEYSVYRRDQTYGAPIYFSPYFTRASGKPEGITRLSKILGILSFNPLKSAEISPDLENFSSDKEQINNWIKGVLLKDDNSDTAEDNIYTYYFLDKPFIFKNPLKKDGGIKKGRGKNWITAMIPPNRCVSFIEFIRHIPELIQNDEKA